MDLRRRRIERIISKLCSRFPCTSGDHVQLSASFALCCFFRPATDSLTEKEAAGDKLTPAGRIGDTLRDMDLSAVLYSLPSRDRREAPIMSEMHDSSKRIDAACSLCACFIASSWERTELSAE